MVLVMSALLLALGSMVSPVQARACACGAISSNTRVTGEVVLVMWDGSRQATDMQMTLDGNATDAGWIMPTPRGATLSVGKEEAFDQLAMAVAPQPRAVRRYHLGFGGQDGAGGARPTQAPGGRPSVVIEGTQDVGPFRVTTLSGDAPAVNDWLVENGYPSRDDLVGAFQQYLDQGWVLQAVKLVPGKSQSDFAQRLPTLRMTFDAATPTYPIRLSRHAQVNQRVRLYLLSNQPLTITEQAAAQQPLTLIYSGPFDTRHITDPLVSGDTTRLTAFEGALKPSTITQDYEFGPDPGAAEFHRTYDVDDDIYLGPWIVLGVALVALAGGVGWLVTRSRRRASGRR